ncbi:hypothetical protein BH11MYX3_BH11MYX3_32020 [soil metagenome]
MQKQSTPWIPEENPSLNGPDYVALVIEWEDVGQDDDDTQITQRFHRAPTALLQVAGATLGAVGAIALAAYGIHRLRAA